MGIEKIVRGVSTKAQVQTSLGQIIDFGLGQGTGTGGSWATATSRFNAVASDLGLPGLAAGQDEAVALTRINDVIDALGVPTDADLYLDFLNGRYFGPTPTDTHATDILALGSTGYETFAPNVLPRTDLGLLTTVGRTNSLAYNTELENAYWAKNANASVTDGTHQAPDGTMTAFTATDSGDGDDFLARTVSVPADSNPSAGSVSFQKTTGATTFPALFMAYTGGTLVQAVAVLDTNTGALSVSSGLTGVVRDEGDFWRISFVLTNNGTNTSLVFRIYPAFTNNPSSTSRIDSVMGSAVGWAPTLEVGASFATDPIITEGSAVTRPGNMPVIDLTGRLGGGVGLVFQADLFAPSGAGDTRRILSINDGSTSNIAFLGRSSVGSLQFSGLSGGSSIGSLSDTYAPGLQTFYLALSESFAGLGVVGGFEGTFTPSAYPTGLNQIGIGTEGINTGVNMYQQAKRLGMFFGPQDAAEFARTKALAQEWAAE